jgi:hypothetical protein
MKKYSLITATIAVIAFLLVGLGVALWKKPIESSDVAAWVQAVGAIVAILTAVFVMNTQYTRDSVRNQRDSLVRHINLSIAGHAAAKRLGDVIQGAQIMIGMSGFDANIISYQVTAFAGALRSIERIPIWDMDAAGGRSVGELAEVCGTICALLDGAAVNPPRDYSAFVLGLTMFLNRTNVQINLLSQTADALRAELNSVR